MVRAAKSPEESYGGQESTLEYMTQITIHGLLSLPSPEPYFLGPACLSFPATWVSALPKLKCSTLPGLLLFCLEYAFLLVSFLERFHGCHYDGFTRPAPTPHHIRSL